MFDTVINAVLTALKDEGIPAVRKFPAEALDRDSAAVAVCLKSGSVTASGYGNYLGVCDRNGELREVYGSSAELTAGIEIYTPAAAGHAEPECTALLGSICACVGALQGVTLRSFECGETRFDPETEMFRCDAALKLTAYLTRSADENGVFTDFVLRGELK
ncbi:MAG: hypothetical protein HUJ66_07345 [Oscillospiraceae bacterium]|nr:hypothetical protein [Oscillospiraceae bacterium]